MRKYRISYEIPFDDLSTHVGVLKGVQNLHIEEVKSSSSNGGVHVPRQRAAARALTERELIFLRNLRKKYEPHVTFSAGDCADMMRDLELSPNSASPMLSQFAKHGHVVMKHRGVYFVPTAPKGK